MINFSIIVPVYNKESFLYKTLLSIKNQSYNNFEVLIVNDGSTDNSIEICKKFTLYDTRFILYHIENHGVSYARNYAISKSKFEYISFLDADDFWSEDYLLKMQELISKNLDNGFFCAKYLRLKNKEIISDEFLFSFNKIVHKFNLLKEFCNIGIFPLHISSVIIKKEIIEEIGGFDTKITTYEDYDLFIRISLISDLIFLNVPNLSFYNLDDPITNKPRGEFPKINNHLIGNLSKYENKINNIYCKKFLDIFLLKKSIKYFLNYRYRNEIKKILKTVDKNNVEIKYKIFFSTPYFISKIIFHLYSKLNL